MANPRKIAQNPPAVAAPLKGYYSNAVKALAGPLLFIAGQVAIDFLRRFFVVRVHGEVSVVEHPEPARVVARKAEAERLFETLFRRAAHVPLRPYRVL